MQGTNLNISPIFDDFDENKNFHRVLFNAGKTVQARELTQAQSILQSQIDRLGKHLFAEGAMVVPGGITGIEAQDCIQFSLSGGALFAELSAETDLFVKSNSNGATFKIAKLFDAVNGDSMSAFLDLLSPGTNQQKKLVSGEQIMFYVLNTNGTERVIALGVAVDVKKGSWVKVQSGVYFVRGMFVRTDDQNYVVSKYTTDATMKVGFMVHEEIVDSNDDQSLLSNANGFPNQGRSGASRLKVTLTLAGLDVGATNKDFIELARFENGSLLSKVQDTEYSIIEDAISRRFYETHGDYVVDQFGLNIKEHLLEGNNQGVYTTASGGDSNKLVAQVKPGVGYVRGYRVSNIGIQQIPFNKARSTGFLNNSTQGADYGQYFLASSLTSLPEIDIKKQILMLDSAANQVGTCRVRALRKDGNSYRFYVFDLSFNSGKTVSNVASLKYTDSSNLVVATLADSVMYDSSKSALIFKLPISAVKTLYTPGIGGETSYVVSRSFNLTTNSSGSVIASVNTNETFGLVNNETYFVALTGASTPGTQFVPTNVLTLGGTPNGSTITINLGSGQANKTIRLIAPVVKNVTTQKSKTLQTITDEIVDLPAVNRARLAKADVYKIISILDSTTNEDLTAQYSLDNGQRPSWYERARIIKIDSAIVTRTVKVTYQYFQHAAGDYFSVDSYSGIRREDIPRFSGVDLADCLDFRPLKDANDDFTSLTVTGEMIRPGDSIRADITYYLPRRDLVVVRSNGTFSVVEGESSNNPVYPETPLNSMRLYELSIPAYTYKPSDVIVKQVDNRRYTMRDIGKLDARISNVEYYTSLSLLESKTNKTQVIDPVTGNTRYKNGFAVDGFFNFNMADIKATDWSASMDLVNGRLNPQFIENGIGFQPGVVSNAQIKTNIYTKSYSEAVVIDQPYATSTININPYAVFTWVGKIELTPNRDFWKDVKYAEPVVINNTINLTGGAVQGTVWNSWTTNSVIPIGWGFFEDVVEDTTTVATTTTISSVNSSSSNDNLLSTEILYYMRTIDIGFECVGFRPFTRLYPFFDGVNVGTECKQNGKNYADPIITDAAGKASGIFTVPNRDDMRFKTGTSVLRFTDNSTDSRGVDDVTTSASTTFQSSGTLDNRQVTTSNTTVLQATTTSTTTTSRVANTRSTNIVGGTGEEQTGGGGDGGGDPIAQTFTSLLSGGTFVSKIDIFFATKAASIPVTLELRTVATGLPTNDVIGSVTLEPAAVSTSADGSVATSFVFRDPIYLQQGAEYAIVLKAETQEYNVFIAVQGENIIGQNMALSKQPYIGVFLTSSNASTWNPDQNKDMKFRVHRAVFSTGTSTVTFNCGAPTVVPLEFNAVSTVSGSSTAAFRCKSHGIKVGDAFTVSGVVGGNGLNATWLNKTHIATAVTVDSVSATVAGPANATGTIGGNSITASINYPFNIFMANVAAVSPAGCDVLWEYNYTGQVNRVKSGWIEMTPFQSYQLATEGVIKQAGDLQVRATLINKTDNLSPCIESSSFNSLLISMRVDPTEKIFNYVSTDIKFDNPTTHGRFIVGARLPGNSGMKFYIKEIDTPDQDIAATPWVQLNPTNPITNSDKYVEYEYQLDGNFVGYKIKVELTGTNTNPPSLLDIRTLAFA